MRCARHSGLGPVLTAPTRPPQPRPPARGPPLWSTRSAPHPRSCGWPLRRRGQTPSRRQRRQYGELARTQQQPQPSWHIRLRSPPPTCPTATSARAPPLGRPASRLRPVFRCLAPCPAPTALPPWHCSELVRQRLNLATPLLAPYPLSSWFPPLHPFVPPLSPRPSPLAPPFRHAPLDSAPRSRPVFRCLIPPSHLVGPAPSRQSFTAPPPWPRPSPTCRVQSAGPASRRRPGYAGSVLQDSCFRI